MKKFFVSLILILSVICLMGSAFAVSPKGSELAQRFATSIRTQISKGNPGWENWVGGIRQEHGGTLKNLTATFQVLDEQTSEQQILIVVEITFTAYFVDKAGNKKRLVLTRAIMVLAELPGLTNLQFLTLGDERKLLPDWNGKDT